ncbi:FeoB-associated Cys-rich membrane protein [bacterium]|nr:FeoB-associated Cys-rich membrane protein [bacterium]
METILIIAVVLGALWYTLIRVRDDFSGRNCCGPSDCVNCKQSSSKKPRENCEKS